MDPKVAKILKNKVHDSMKGLKQELNMPCGKKRKRQKMNNHKRKKRLRANRHKKKNTQLINPDFYIVYGDQVVFLL